MKRIFSLFFFAAMLVNCSADAQQKVVVEGTVSPEATMAYLVDAANLRTLIDSVPVTNGHFTVELPAKENNLVYLSAKGCMQFFFTEGEKVTVDAMNDVIEGTGLNEQWGKYNAEVKAAEDDADTIKKIVLEYCKANKGTKLPIAIMMTTSEDAISDALPEVMEICKENVAITQHPYLAQLAYMIKQRAQRAVGSSLKDIAIPDAKGNMHKLSEYVGKNKYVLVDFWASWCGPCCREMPNVVEAYNKYKSKGLEIVGVSLDQKKEPWLAAVERMNMTWPQLSDLKGWKCEAADLYGVKAIPSNILFDKDGKIIATDLTGPALERKLAKLFE